MIIGVLSDTHGQVQRAANAVALLGRLGAEAYVHCGDIGGAEVLDQFVGLPAHFVLGNTDYPDASLVRYGRQLELNIVEQAPLRLELGGKLLLVFHGHEAGFQRLLGARMEQGAPLREFGDVAYVLHGHTHTAREVLVGSVRVVNPGALQRALVYSVATIDLARDDVQFWHVFDDPGETEPMRFRPSWR